MHILNIPEQLRHVVDSRKLETIYILILSPSTDQIVGTFFLVAYKYASDVHPHNNTALLIYTYT